MSAEPATGSFADSVPSPTYTSDEAASIQDSPSSRHTSQESFYKPDRSPTPEVTRVESLAINDHSPVLGIATDSAPKSVGHLEQPDLLTSSDPLDPLSTAEVSTSDLQDEHKSDSDERTEQATDNLSAIDRDESQSEPPSVSSHENLPASDGTSSLAQPSLQGPVKELDMSHSELVAALEPFGLWRDKASGKQSTQLRNLPAIFAKFQASRDTLYFSERMFQDIQKHVDINPDAQVDNEWLIPFMEFIKDQPYGNDVDGAGRAGDPDQLTLQPKQSGMRIRTAESPPSSDGDQGYYYGSRSPSSTSSTPNTISRTSAQLYDKEPLAAGSTEGDESFDSTNETTLRSLSVEDDHGQHTDLAKTTLNAFHSVSTSTYPKPDKHRSVPNNASDPRRGRPRPPNRRKKRPSLNDPQTSPDRRAREDSSSLGHAYLPSGAVDAALEQNLFSREGLAIDRRSTTSPMTADDPRNPPTPLTAVNMSTVIFGNRQKGLYAEQHDDSSDLSSAIHQLDCGDTELMRRLRPDSKVFTRVFESGIGLDDYPTPQNHFDVQHMCEEYPNLARSCQELRAKNKDLENQISAIGKQHEDEVLSLTEQMDELTQELSMSKKSEKDLAAVESKQRRQLQNADDDMSRMQKELAMIQNNYVNTKQKWELTVGELENTRSQLQSKEGELRHAKRSAESHTTDMGKWQTERKFLEDRIKKLQIELQELHHAREILEEQKQANLELKATIDRLKYDLEEQRNRNSGSNASNSRPSSFAGSLGPTFGEELKRAMASEQYDDEGSGSDTTEEAENEMTRIVKGLGEGGSINPDHDLYEEIEITRKIKRRQSRKREDTILSELDPRSRTIEEFIDLQDASTDCDGLISVTSVHAQTDAIPEPPPLYRPKMEDLQVQTEDIVSEGSSCAIQEASARVVFDKLAKEFDLTDLSRAIETIVRSKTEGHPLDGNSPTNSTSSALPTREDPIGQLSKLSYLKRMVFSPPMGSSFTNTIINVFPPINFHKPTPFGRLESSLLNSSMKICSSVLFLLTSGYFLGNLLFSGTPSSQALFIDFLGSPNAAMNAGAWLNLNTILAVGQEGFYIGPVAISRPSMLRRLGDVGVRIVWDVIAVSRRVSS